MRCSPVVSMRAGRCGVMKLDKWEEGRVGESAIRKHLKHKKLDFFQADLIIRDGEKWYLGEVKHQEMFEAPPFDGHGLPQWQIAARLEFQRATGVRAVLFVVDKKTKVIYWQYLDMLSHGKRFQTTGKKPRVIFPLDNFKVLTK